MLVLLNRIIYDKIIGEV